jgi:hypothetical protein
VDEKTREGWIRLEDRNHYPKHLIKSQMIEQYFYGVGIYGHEPFMYDHKDVIIIRTGRTADSNDFTEWH